MAFSGDVFTHLFDWVLDPPRPEKIFNARLEAEFDGIDTALSTVKATNTALAAPQYIVAAASSDLANERVPTNTATITWDFSVAGQAKANFVGSITNSTVLFGSGGSGTCAAGATKYIGAALMSATEGEVVFPLPVAGTLRNLRILGSNPGSAGETLTCTLRVALADTALVATITNGTNVANDTTHTVAAVAGDRTSVKLVNSASGATQGPVSWSCELVI